MVDYGRSINPSDPGISSPFINLKLNHKLVFRFNRYYWVKDICYENNIVMIKLQSPMFHTLYPIKRKIKAKCQEKNQLKK